MRARLTAAMAALRHRGARLYTPTERAVDKREYAGTVPTGRIPVPEYTGPAAGIKPPPLKPHYLSTYCHHGWHDRCRLSCKVCGAPCQCPCHDPEET